MAGEIAQAFERVATDRKGRLALLGLGGLPTCTFDQLAEDAREMRRAFASSGLPPAPSLVCAIGNHPAFFAVFLAVLADDGAAVLFDAPDRFERLEAAAAEFGADGLVVPAAVAATLGLAGAALPAALTLVRLRRLAAPRWHHDRANGPTILKMTSGSSESPRAVVARERHLVADARHIVRAMDIGPDDVNLGVIPFAHSYGLGNLVLPLLLQGSAIAVRDSFAPRQLGEDVVAAGVTVMPGVPYMYDHLRRHDLAGSLAGVRRLITAGAPVGLDTVAFFKRAVGVKLHSFYGSSETGGITFDDGEDVGDRVTVGRPLPGVQVELRRAIDADAGGGRVFVQGDSVADGYAWPDESADRGATFVDGGFLTGDLARFEDGDLLLIGRVSSFINVAGRKVDPAEIERVLRHAPDVLDVHVFGMACDRRGEQVIACVRRDGKAQPVAELRAYCAARLPAYKVPREIVDVDAVPRDARGKVSRRALEQLVSRVRGA